MASGKLTAQRAPLPLALPRTQPGLIIASVRLTPDRGEPPPLGTRKPGRTDEHTGVKQHQFPEFENAFFGPKLE